MAIPDHTHTHTHALFVRHCKKSCQSDFILHVLHAFPVSVRNPPQCKVFSLTHTLVSETGLSMRSGSGCGDPQNQARFRTGETFCVSRTRDVVGQRPRIFALVLPPVNGVIRRGSCGVRKMQCPIPSPTAYIHVNSLIMLAQRLANNIPLWIVSGHRRRPG